MEEVFHNDTMTLPPLAAFKILLLSRIQATIVLREGKVP
jgi:hypothetical protein